MAEVGHVESDKLAPAQRAREAEEEEEEEEDPFSTPRRVGAEPLEHRTQIGHRYRAHLALGRAEGQLAARSGRGSTANRSTAAAA